MKRAVCCALSALLLLLGQFAVSACAEITPLPLDDDTVYGCELREDAFLSETEYRDDSIHAVVKVFEYGGVECIQVTIRVVDPSQIRTTKSTARFDDHEMVKATLMSKKANAVVAINGDFFKHHAFGYTIRQCQEVRKRLIDQASAKYDVLMIDNMGDFHVVKTATAESAQALEDEIRAGGRFVVNSFTFGPVLVQDGVRQDFNQKLWQAYGKAQRIAIAQADELTYMVFQCDGATEDKTGLTMNEFADMIVSRCDHIRVAYNLDGGGSTNVIFGKEKINDNRDVRQICDILYFASIDNQENSK